MGDRTPEQLEAACVRVLRELGVTEYESHVFVSLIRLGTGTAKDVADVSEVPRTGVYDAVDTLHDAGLVDIQYTSPRKFTTVSRETAIRKLDLGRRNTITELRELLENLEVAGVLRYDIDRRVVIAFDQRRVDSLLEGGRRVLTALQANRQRLLDGTAHDEERLRSLIEAGSHVLDSLRDGTDGPGTGSPCEVVRLPETVVPLTSTQRGILASACEEGYFETPRGVTLEELAEHHPLSLLEASRSLRVALDAVLEAVDLDP